VVPRQAASSEPTIASRYLYRLGDSQDPAGTFHTPTDLAVGEDGSLYVYDESNARIQRLSRSGEVLAVWGRDGSGDGMFASMSAQADVAVGPDGSDYVADGRHYRVQRFDAMGRFLGSWGAPGDGPGQFSSTLLALAVGPDGTVFVADPEASRIHRFTSNGEVIDAWQGAPLHRLQKPDQIAISPDGARLYGLDTVERESAQLLLYTPDGSWIGVWTSGDSPTVELVAAWALTVAPDGEVYVVDIDWRNETTTSRIQRLSADGIRLAS
jgi:DNA-binding beta-propeller fold protein YncE